VPEITDRPARRKDAATAQECMDAFTQAVGGLLITSLEGAVQPKQLCPTEIRTPSHYYFVFLMKIY
jgi:hypothetical protein